ncbi:MAG: NUDIX domain-containing protein [Nitrospiraceae bacterium]|nr:NUDIX domain-containing protein [Nitrospiraceae bacterium]
MRTHLRSKEDHTELFDVLDSRGIKTGEVIARDEAHRIGAWHGAFHCLIIGQRQGRGYALFQKRSTTKKIAPGKFDVSVGGHYASGEDAGVAGPREIKEELGLEVSFSDLVPLGRRVFVYGFTPGVREYEFQDIFLLPRTISVRDLTLQREELDGVVEMDVEAGIALFSGKMRQMDLLLNKSDGSGETGGVTADDFVPGLDNYYLKLLLLAQRYLEGEREALVI